MRVSAMIASMISINLLDIKSSIPNMCVKIIIYAISYFRI